VPYTAVGILKSMGSAGKNILMVFPKTGPINLEGCKPGKNFK
jgi:hypothetical protein